MSMYAIDKVPAPRARSEIHPAVQKLIAGLGPASGLKALDAPLGPGAMALYLYQMGYAVSGLDMDLKQSVGLPSTIQRQQGSLIEQFPFPDSHFDLTISLEGIEHVENHFQMLRELARVTKPGGRLLISTPSISNLEDRLSYLAKGHFGAFISRADVEREGAGFHHINLISYFELRQVLDLAGFQVERVARDRVKWAMTIFLSPLWLLLKVYLMLQPSKRKQKYLLSETGSNDVLLGGSTLIIQARKL